MTTNLNSYRLPSNDTDDPDNWSLSDFTLLETLGTCLVYFDFRIVLTSILSQIYSIFIILNEWY